MKLKCDVLVSSLCVQMQLVPLHRGVRNLLEAAKRAQALRLADMKGTKTIDDLTTLTMADCEFACGRAKK